MMSNAGLSARIVVTRDGFTLDIDLLIDPGTTVALLGPNGSGKSTTVDAIAGIVPLDAGRIDLAGRTMDDPEQHVFVPVEERRVGVVFQRYLLFDHLDVIDNVAFGLVAGGEQQREARRRAQELLDALGMADLSVRRPSELSGGQAQRVALARALATEPDILLLDEPLAALDVSTRAQLRRMLRAHLDGFEGPRLLITHDPADAFLLADRVHILEAGRITQTGHPDEIRRRPATPYVAALAGLNLLTATNCDGRLTLDDYAQPLRCADVHTSGSVLVTIHPNAIALHAQEPHGSPRNAWQTTIVALEPLGEITRVTLGDPLPLGVDVTPGAVESLQLTTGSSVWASIKATEIHIHRV